MSSACPSIADLLRIAGGDIGDAPDDAAGHVETCPTCRERVRRLRRLEDGPVATTAPLPVGTSLELTLGPPASSGEIATDDAAKTPDEADPLSGRQVHAYELLEVIGRGGMGVVYKARHSRLRRIVALKVLSPELASREDLQERFHREMEAVGRIDHENVVAAQDAGEADGVTYLAMEYVPGRDLRTLVTQDGPMPPDEAVEAIVQAARGLACAHDLGFVHRDVKPSNLIRVVSDGDAASQATGTVKVLDLGLARLESAAAGSGQTQAGHIVGTIDYMAPEQAVDFHDADARADLYALGCTLFFLLTGRVPFPAEKSLQTLLAHRTDPRPDPRPVRAKTLFGKEPTSRDAIPAGLVAVLHRMMAIDPADRPASMPELIAELRPYRPAAARPPRRSAKPDDSPTAMRVAAVLLLLLGSLLAIASVSVGVQTQAYGPSGGQAMASP